MTGYQGDIRFDSSKPDGSPRKLLDSSLVMSLGWQPRVQLHDGLQRAYADFTSKLVAEPA